MQNLFIGTWKLLMLAWFSESSKNIPRIEIWEIKHCKTFFQEKTKLKNEFPHKETLYILHVYVYLGETRKDVFIAKSQIKDTENILLSTWADLLVINPSSVWISFIY